MPGLRADGGGIREAVQYPYNAGYQGKETSIEWMCCPKEVSTLAVDLLCCRLAGEHFLNIADANSLPVSMIPSGSGLRLLLKDRKLRDLSFLGLGFTFVVEGRSSTGETTAD